MAIAAEGLLGRLITRICRNPKSFFKFLSEQLYLRRTDWRSKYLKANLANDKVGRIANLTSAHRKQILILVAPAVRYAGGEADNAASTIVTANSDAGVL